MTPVPLKTYVELQDLWGIFHNSLTLLCYEIIKLGSTLRQRERIEMFEELT